MKHFLIPETKVFVADVKQDLSVYNGERTNKYRTNKCLFLHQLSSPKNPKAASAMLASRAFKLATPTAAMCIQNMPVYLLHNFSEHGEGRQHTIFDRLYEKMCVFSPFFGFKDFPVAEVPRESWDRRIAELKPG